ncbi:MAG: hypothetical protein KJO29_03825 [Bacteroidia bacterium]|nr:hypothetical protein [Bacteroidia bacterium]
MESNTLKDLKILHLALVLGMLVVATLIYFLSDPEMNALRINLQVDETLALLLAVANLIGVSYFHNKRLPGIQSMDSIEEKWINYRALQIMKYALVEGAGLIAIVIFFGKGNLLLLIIALVLTLTLYLMKPTRERTARDLKLTVEEEAGL